MKKSFALAALFFALLFSLQGQMPPQQTQMKLEDVQKALSLVDKPQPVPADWKAGFDSITDRDVIAMLTYLSSDLMEGRETGTRGYQLAADYAASLFKMWGLKPAGDMPSAGGGRFRGMGGGQPAAPAERSYFQEFALREVSDTQSSMTVDVLKNGALKTHVFNAGVDYQAGMGGSAETVSAPVVFAGYGISEPSIGWDELKGLNLKGKIVLLLSEAPGKDDPASPFQAKKELKDKYFPAMPQFDMAMMRRGGGPARFSKTAEIGKLGAVAILQVQNAGKDSDIYKQLSAVRRTSDDRPARQGGRRRLTMPGAAAMPFEASSPVIGITREMANAILEGAGLTIDDLKARIEKGKKPASMDLPGAKVTVATTAKSSLVRTMNVLGYIEGSDPKLKDEYFVVGGHFDGLGAEAPYVWNGADDNASGSVGVMAIARAMALNPVKPKRSVVFALWTGEEEGLHGSRYYVQNPVFPIEKTVGYLNYDMISRPYDETTLARTARMYAVPGAEALVKKIRPAQFATVQMTENSGFAELTRQMNQYVGLDLAIRESALGVGGGGSDHSSFASVKVPYFYYMAAMTTDYHQTSDSVEKVSGEIIAKITKMGYLTVLGFVNK